MPAKIQVTLTLEQKLALEKYKATAEKKLKKKLKMSTFVAHMLVSFMELSPLSE